jgi:arsenical pump membrane protein
VVVLVTLVGFFVTSLLHVAPAFAALAGAVALAVPALARRRAKARDLALALDVPFLAFVISLALVVKAVSLHGLSSVVARLMPDQVSLWSLLAVATMAAVLANVMNNLPAVLLLLPAAAAVGPAVVLAVLIGVNTGPNLTYVGSLATLLWRRALRQRGEELPTSEFLRLGVVTVPPVLVVSTLALWASLKLVG